MIEVGFQTTGSAFPLSTGFGVDLNAVVASFRV
jgi:hypothetical protein